MASGETPSDTPGLLDDPRAWRSAAEQPVGAILAVLVTDGISPYLRRTLEGVAAQQHGPARLLVVDVAGYHGGAGPAMQEEFDALLTETGVAAATDCAVLRVPGAANFAGAVNRALEDDAPTRELARTEGAWLWFLHDDAAPDPGALAALRERVRGDARLAVVGPKQRGWTNPDLLLEVGVRATRGGRRLPSFDESEIDQGQHDDRSEVLAVGTAGMLVRASVWRDLGGFDPVLGQFGDGLEFCRRARLAGHEVRVVPEAVVHHARASFTGLRRPGEPGVGTAPRSGRLDRDGDHTPDTRRSFRARRGALAYNTLVAASPLAVPFLLLGLLLLAPVRALGRLATKEWRLALAEFAAIGDALASLRGVRAARRRLRATATRTQGDLRPFETTAGQIRAARRDHRRNTSALRRMRRAPSELEIRERAALAAARRRWIIVLTAVLLVAGLALSGHLLGAFPTGGALAALPGTLGELWQAARSGWIATGVGLPGPADPLLTVLAVLSAPSAMLGVQPSTTVALVLVLAPLAAGLGAWFAAGAATRRTTVRAWAALVWALSPTMLLGLVEGRVGVALAAAALPWVALSIAWVTGARRRDLLLPGLVGARRRRRRPAAGPEAPDARAPGTSASPAVPTTPRLTVFADLLDEGEDVDALLAGGPTPPASRRPEVVRRRDDAIDESQFEAAIDSFDAAPARRGSGHNTSISLMATAGGGLALAIATAGVPALLPVAALALALLCVVVPFGRRYFALMLVPALALHLPVLLAAARTGAWPALLADSGFLLATPAAGALAAAAGWPEDPSVSLALGNLAGPAGSPGLEIGGLGLADLAPWAWLALLPLGLVALVPGGRAARATRGAWLLVALGLLAHAVTTRVVVGAGATPAGSAALVTGWGGAGTLLVTAGLLAACLVADGVAHEARVRAAHVPHAATQVAADAHDAVAAPDAHESGAREPGAHAVEAPAPASAPRGVRVLGGVLSWSLAALPVLAAVGFVVSVPGSDARLLGSRGMAVPALSQQVAQSPERARTLALSLADDTLAVAVLRGDGRLLTESSTLGAHRLGAVAEGALDDPLGTATVTTAAHLAGGGGTDLARRLGELGIGVVLVPPVGTAPGGESDASVATATVREHDDLVARIDAVPGLERVTVNASGTVWRVVASREDGVSTARARITDAAGAPLAELPAGTVDVDAPVPAAEDGDGERLVVLAERADGGWHAEFDDVRGAQMLPARSLEDGRQAFEIPAAAGTLRVTHGAPGHTILGAVQVFVLLAAAITAVPVRRGGIHG